MTLAELKSLFRSLIFDRAPSGSSVRPFDDATQALLINLALQRVWNVARRLQSHLFVSTQTIATGYAPGTDHTYVPVTLAPPYTRVKRVLACWRTDGTAPGALQKTKLAASTQSLDGEPDSHPRYALWGEQVVLLNPPQSLTVRLHYVHGLPELTHATNTPGQTGADDLGTANDLPVEYHGLIALRAAVLGLKAERAADWASLDKEYQEAVADMAAALGDSERLPEAG